MDDEPGAWTTCPDEVAQRLDDLVVVCDGLTDSWARIGRQLSLPLAPTSPCGGEAALLRAAYPEFPQGFLEATGSSAGQYVDAIGQIIQSIGAELRARRVTLGVWPQARAIVELAGRAGWLLQPPDDQGSAISSSARAARYVMETLADVCRHRYTASRRGASKDEIRRLKVAREEIRAHAGTLTPGAALPWTSPGDEADWELCEQKYPSLGRASDAFVRRWFGDARAIYDLLSDRAHPSLLSLKLCSQVVPRNGRREIVYVIPADTVEWQVQVACLAWYRSAHLVAWYLGLSDEPLEAWAESSSLHFPGWFASGDDVPDPSATPR